jgi:hypothetical protein
MKKIKLYKNDIEFILSNLKDIPEHTSDKLKQLYADKIKPEGICVDEYDVLRDLCGEMLQICGFDEKYHPNKEGIILEDLIDKLYTIKNP